MTLYNDVAYHIGARKQLLEMRSISTLPLHHLYMTSALMRGENNNYNMAEYCIMIIIIIIFYAYNYYNNYYK